VKKPELHIEEKLQIFLIDCFFYENNFIVQRKMSG